MNEHTPNAAVSAADLKDPSEDANLQSRIDELEEENATLKQQTEELENKYKLLASDWHNSDKRMKKQHASDLKYAISKFAKEILDIGDILSTAISNCEDKENEHYQGMKMTLDKFYSILQQHGIKHIESLHQEYNHDIHEALTSQETEDIEPGRVLQVIQEGYLFEERLLRAAKVIVSKKVSEDS